MRLFRLKHLEEIKRFLGSPLSCDPRAIRDARSIDNVTFQLEMTKPVLLMVDTPTHRLHCVLPLLVCHLLGRHRRLKLSKIPANFFIAFFGIERYIRIEMNPLHRQTCV